jgi:SPP1 family phage portal protein
MSYLTATEIINYKLMADKALIDSSQIEDMINRDLISPIKLSMNEGINYYNGQHDYLTHKNKYIVDGKEIEDKLKANNLIIHPFLKTLINQKIAYIAGNQISVTVAEPDIEDEESPTTQESKNLTASQEFQTLLLEQLGDGFNDTVNDMIKGSSSKGIEWLHFYINKSGELKYVITPAQQIIAIYDTQYQDRLLYVIRFYAYDIIEPIKGKLATRYKVEWWTDKEVTYWEQQIDGTFVHDPNYELNPTSHWQSFNTNNPGVKLSHSWGKVPFVALPSNSDYTTDLKDIKALIDAYDKIKSGWCNDLQDFQELIYVLKGYEGISEAGKSGYSELGFFIQNLRVHKAIKVSSDGGVETLKAEIPIEAKTKFLEITRKEIFYFGEGVDITDEKISNSPSGVSLKILYAPLDMKANRMINKLKVCLKEFMWFVVEYINFRDKKKYDYKQIMFTINKSTIFNEKEIIDGLVASVGMISEKTILEKHPYVDDVDEEIARLEADRKRADELSGVDLSRVSDKGAKMYDADGNLIDTNKASDVE